LITKAEHIGIMVTDLDRSIAFYQDILGLKLRQRTTTATGTNIAFFQVGNVEIELVAGSANGYHPGDGIVNHLAFTVSDLDAMIEHLKAHQVETISPKPIPVWEGMRVFFFRGPDGEKLELCEHRDV